MTTHRHKKQDIVHQYAFQNHSKNHMVRKPRSGFGSTILQTLSIPLRLAIKLTSTSQPTKPPIALTRRNAPSNDPNQPRRSGYRSKDDYPPRGRNLPVIHSLRKTPSQEPQRVQPMESENPRNPELDSGLSNPRQRAERRRNGLCGEIKAKP